MSTITFDTIKYADKLEAAGFTPAQAKAEAQALAEVMSTGTQELATKDDIAILRSEIRTQKAEIMGEIYKALLIQTFAIAGLIAALIKLLGH